MKVTGNKIDFDNSVLCYEICSKFFFKGKLTKENV